MGADVKGEPTKTLAIRVPAMPPQLAPHEYNAYILGIPEPQYIQKTCIKLRKTVHDPQHDRLRGSYRGSARRLPHGRPAQRQSSVPRSFDPAARRASRARVRVTRAPGSRFEARQGRMQDFAQSG